MREKAITLDIARRLRRSLRKEGYRVSLTRNNDSYLSIEQRVLLAQQLRADLFVSVHVNACPWRKEASGLETYFLKAGPYRARDTKVSFLFVKNAHDRSLATVANKMLSQKVHRSRQLSKSIQNGVLQHLKKRRIPIKDRGVKLGAYRCLWHNKVPAAIVEVGFLTNRTEAKRLSTPTYRHMLAQGIGSGIKRFLRENTAF